MTRTHKRRLATAVPVAVAILAAVTGCSDSPGTSAAAPAARTPATYLSGPQNVAATVPGAPMPDASAAAADDPAGPPSSGAGTTPPAVSVRQAPGAAQSTRPGERSAGTVGPVTDIGDAVLLKPSDLPTWSPTRWAPGNDRTAADGPLPDPDHCDPGAQMPGGGSPYPATSRVVNALTKSWILPTTYALTTETVLTYPSADAAAADLRLHRSWLSGCAAAFSWTEMPHAQTIARIDLPIPDAFAYRAAMYAPGEPAATAGTQGYAYTAVIQRGNSLAVLVTTSDSGAVAASPSDPGAGWITGAADRLAARLAAAYR